jgi:hypothetical protein
MAQVHPTTAERAFHPPHFDRLNYFYGQMLGVSDFCAEQSFFREKAKLHNRCLHGYGTVCGLRVLAPPAEPACPGQAEKPIVHLEPGLALDAEGHELIVRAGEGVCGIDLWESLTAADQQTVNKQLGDDPQAWYDEPLYVSLHYHAWPLGPSRPVAVDSCGGTLPNAYGRLRDGVRVSVSLKKPEADRRCETCCCDGPCACDGLLLARISRFHRHRAVKPEHVHNEVRRRVGTYAFTTITGVNWAHGREYHRDAVRLMLKEGLVVHFSRPVWVDPVHQRGAIDVYHVESRNTRHPNIIELRGEIAPCPAPTHELRYHIPHLEECPEKGDRLFVVVRCGFLLDECCRPVDGLNVGGRIPRFGEEYPPCGEETPRAHGDAPCGVPPWGYGPWASGNGTGGGTFESWFYVADNKGEHHHER